MRAGFARIRNRVTSILVSWPFLSSLAVLIANDLYLKSAFPGWLTGKLSDFAGIYLAALLITAVSTKAKYIGAVVLALGFVYWKSPASQWLIDNVNAFFYSQIGRVVDYSDLLALIAIPVAWATVANLSSRSRRSLPRQLLSIPVALITVLAVSGTSVLIPHGEYAIRNADKENLVSDAALVSAIERVATKYRLQCLNCDATADETVYFNEDMDFSYSLDPASNGIRFRVSVTKMKGWLLPKPDYELFDRFMRDLKLEFGELSPSMEFVQSLSGPPYSY